MQTTNNREKWKSAKIRAIKVQTTAIECSICQRLWVFAPFFSGRNFDVGVVPSSLWLLFETFSNAPVKYHTLETSVYLNRREITVWISMSCSEMNILPNTVNHQPNRHSAQRSFEVTLDLTHPTFVLSGKFYSCLKMKTRSTGIGTRHASQHKSREERDLFEV